MNESLAGYVTLLLKMFVDWRQFRGPSEFSYRILFGISGRYRIRVSARDGAFCSTVSMRRQTSDLATFEQVFANNDYNLRRLERWHEVVDLYNSLSEKGMPLILDLGANIGLASLYLAKNWPKARIIAVERETRNYRVMCDNLECIENALLLHAAIASEDGAVKIADPDATGWAIRTEIVAPETADAVAALSVPSLLRMAPESLPFIAKIDIEGFERELFSKNTEWVKLFPVIIIELHDWMFPGQGTAINFLRAISEQERDIIFVGENIISILNPCRSAVTTSGTAADHCLGV